MNPPFKVVNRHTRDPNRTVRRVYCGRPSIWGNPFSIGEGRFTRQESIWKYFWHLVATPHKLRRINDLRGCDLECFCAPRECHCDVLIQLANDAHLHFQFVRLLSNPGVTEETFNHNRDSLSAEQVDLVHGIMAKVFPSAMQRMIAACPPATTVSSEILTTMRANGDMGTPEPAED